MLMNPPKDIFKFAESTGFGQIHLKIDPKTGLYAIIAIHNLQQGPALGGCRWISYANPSNAVYDALRLAKGMTYKAAISHLAHGGGKSVIIRPKYIEDKEAYFASFAEFIEQLGGQYITAVDSGTTSAEMDIISKYTRHVSCTSNSGNPSGFTALGVLRGIQAAVKHKLNRENLSGLHIAIQGVGEVGYRLAQLCYEQGAHLSVCDTNPSLTQRCANEFNAKIVKTDNIYSVKCDVFSPCALGGILNDKTIAKLNTAIVAGSANNQLHESQHGQLLHRLDILYAPDYVINAGGLIQASGKHYGLDDGQIEQKVNQIYSTLEIIFQRSKETKLSTSDIADNVATEILEKGDIQRD